MIQSILLSSASFRAIISSAVVAASFSWEHRCRVSLDSMASSMPLPCQSSLLAANVQRSELVFAVPQLVMHGCVR